MPSLSRTCFRYSTARVSLPGGLLVSMRTSAWKCASVSASIAFQSIGVWARTGAMKMVERTARNSIRVVMIADGILPPGGDHRVYPRGWSDGGRRAASSALAAAAYAQPRDQFREVRRRRRFEPHRPIVGGMAKCQTVRVQRLTRERDRPEIVGSVDITLLADEGVPAQPRLNPNLVAPPGDQRHLDQRRAGQPLDDAVAADRLLAARV